MRYYIQRGDQQYGPYTLPDLRKYVSDGNIVVNDLARREDAADWIPVSQILAETGAPPPPGPVFGMTTPAPETPAIPQPARSFPRPAVAAATGPVPPDFHWALVLVLGFVTCGIFSLVWTFIEANFVKKIDRSSNAIPLLIVTLILEFGGVIAVGIGGETNSDAVAGAGSLVYLGALVLFFVAIFGMRSSLLGYYNTTEPYGLRLNPVLTFFFNILYFQHHLSKIAQWKRTGVRP